MREMLVDSRSQQLEETCQKKFGISYGSAFCVVREKVILCETGINKPHISKPVVFSSLLGYAEQLIANMFSTLKCAT